MKGSNHPSFLGFFSPRDTVFSACGLKRVGRILVTW